MSIETGNEFKATILAIGNGANKVLIKFSQKHTANLNLVNINTDKEILDTLKSPEMFILLGTVY